MSGQRGQALAEVALCLPIVLTLALGSVAVARVADARGGLDAATAAAVEAAARAADPNTAANTAQAVFTASVGAYGLGGPRLALELGSFARGSQVTAAGSATVAIGFAPLPGLAQSLTLTSHASARVEPWRSR
ncbi:MAG TPA: TadE/TadG family type IV pilus assembly protein [Candidatus Dormibacteraeota bacterium]